MQTVSLGGIINSSKLGYGAMSLTSNVYKTPEGYTDEYGVSVLKRAMELGITYIDTALLYGMGHNEVLVGRAIAGLSPQQRGKLFIGTKTGLYYEDGYKVSNKPEYLRETCMKSLQRLGTPYIDIFYMHRIDSSVPIEESMTEMKKLVEEGYIRGIGLSEASPNTVRKAHAIHPIAAVQLEWSLWARDAEAELIPTCRELGIGIVAYSPLGKGLLTGTIKKIDDISEDDWRRIEYPICENHVFDHNVKLVEKVEELAVKKGCSAANLALAWVLAQGDDVVPIPGTARVDHNLSGQYHQKNNAAHYQSASNVDTNNYKKNS
ncbi:uncharacterized protein LOC142345303 isoform X2 [Convolutriloba macropyga]|uniref:uncharacterized protein LOC142345303 isoform X2 n=1 Tax=Convolutriloba macropyga TaxID=536237 RepID=UPI003F526708